MTNAGVERFIWRLIGTAIALTLIARRIRPPFEA